MAERSTAEIATAVADMNDLGYQRSHARRTLREQVALIGDPELARRVERVFASDDRFALAVLDEWRRASRSTRSED